VAHAPERLVARYNLSHFLKTGLRAAIPLPQTRRGGSACTPRAELRSFQPTTAAYPSASIVRRARTSAFSRSSGCLPLSRKSNGNGRPGSGSSAYLGTMWVCRCGRALPNRQVVQPTPTGLPSTSPQPCFRNRRVPVNGCRPSTEQDGAGKLPGLGAGMEAASGCRCRQARARPTCPAQRVRRNGCSPRLHEAE
jgi:hypothetical protein